MTETIKADYFSMLFKIDCAAFYEKYIIAPNRAHYSQNRQSENYRFYLPIPSDEGISNLDVEYNQNLLMCLQKVIVVVDRR